MITSTLISIDDFKGYLKVSQNVHAGDDFDEFILRDQDKLFLDLLPGNLYLDFIADVNAANPTAGEPSKEKYIDLLNGTSYTDGDKVIIVRGALEALKHFVYWTSIQEEPYKNSPSGTVVTKNENSETINRKQLNAQTNKRYNEGVELYEVLIAFLEFFEEVSKAYSTIIEGPAGTYTVTISDTEYLDLGDTIAIDNSEFIVDVSITQNAEIVFTSDPGLSFDDNESVSWKPFEGQSPNERGKIFW